MSDTYELPNGAWNAIWDAAWNDFYDVSFEAAIAQSVLATWDRFDGLNRVMVTITASGSAVAGWVLWKTTGWNDIWLGLSSTARFLAVVHSSLSVADRLKRHAATAMEFSRIESSLSTFLLRMRTGESGRDVASLNQKIEAFREDALSAASRRPTDFLRTNRRQRRIKEAVGERIGN